MHDHRGPSRQANTPTTSNRAEWKPSATAPDQGSAMNTPLQVVPKTSQLRRPAAASSETAFGTPPLGVSPYHPDRPVNDRYSTTSRPDQLTQPTAQRREAARLPVHRGAPPSVVSRTVGSANRAFGPLFDGADDLGQQLGQRPTSPTGPAVLLGQLTVVTSRAWDVSTCISRLGQTFIDVALGARFARRLLSHRPSPSRPPSAPARGGGVKLSSHGSGPGRSRRRFGWSGGSGRSRNRANSTATMRGVARAGRADDGRVQ